MGLNLPKDEPLKKGKKHSRQRKKCASPERDWLVEIQEWGRTMSLDHVQPGREVREEIDESSESTQMMKKSADQFSNCVYCQRF